MPVLVVLDADEDAGWWAPLGLMVFSQLTPRAGAGAQWPPGPGPGPAPGHLTSPMTPDSFHDVTLPHRILRTSRGKIYYHEIFWLITRIKNNKPV